MIPVPAFLEELARLGLQAVLNGLWQGLLLTAVVAAGLRLLRGTRPATRHRVWLATLLVVVSLPLAALLRSRAAPAAEPMAVTSSPTAAERAGLEAVAGLAAGQHITTHAPRERRAWRVEVSGGGWVVVLVGFGLLIAAARAARVVWALGGLRRLKRTSRPLPPAYRAPVERVRDQHLRRAVELRASDHVAAPLTLGFLHPAILFPARLLEELEQEELLQVTLHELAHVRRGDAWTNLAQRFLEAFFFFHPAVHWIGRRLELERELACDEYVVAHSAGERAYARCLTRLAELTVEARYARLAPGAAPRGGQLTHRVRALLAPDRAHRGETPVAVCSVLVVGIAAGGAALLRSAPEIGIRAQERPPAMAASSLPSSPAGGDVGPRRPLAEERGVRDPLPDVPAVQPVPVRTEGGADPPMPASVRPAPGADRVLVAATTSARRVEPAMQRSMPTLPAGAAEEGTDASLACSSVGAALECDAAGREDPAAPVQALAGAAADPTRNGEEAGSGAAAARPTAARGGGRGIDIGVTVALPLPPQARAARGGIPPFPTGMPPQPTGQPAPVMNMVEAIRGEQVEIRGGIRLRIGGGTSWRSPPRSMAAW